MTAALTWAMLRWPGAVIALLAFSGLALVYLTANGDQPTGITSGWSYRMVLAVWLAIFFILGLWI